MVREINGKTRKTQIVILGGGFAGVETARYLDRTAAKRADVEVTLVSRDNFTLFTPTLDEVAAGDLEPAHICNPLRKLLRHVTVLSGEIKAIDRDDLLRDRGAYPRVAVWITSFWRLGRKRTISEFQAWPNMRLASRRLAMR